ncbi:hypothetical protein IW249_004366 [Micromonospora vinacea]|uniref:Uncharacterized protein n=1 Tax=Micromonospora vinacea TaxID=709878 RepID=A0ABS0K5R5_9ACTN|nr:hypothetical protein [Micromonospora vinacea]
MAARQPAVAAMNTTAPTTISAAARKVCRRASDVA